jgi:hypothetical protein
MVPVFGVFQAREHPPSLARPEFRSAVVLGRGSRNGKEEPLQFTTVVSGEGHTITLTSDPHQADDVALVIITIMLATSLVRVLRKITHQFKELLRLPDK